MFLSLVLLALASIATPFPFSSRTLSACSQTKKPACSCPEGTTLQESTTQWLMMANVSDVMGIMGSFQTTSWFLTSPDYVTGPDNTVGSSRTLTGSTPEGPAQFTEALFGYSSSSEGFKMEYYLENAPINYVDPSTSLPGSFAGYWDVLTVHGASSSCTFIQWAIYACITAPQLDGIRSFREAALANVNSILEAEGKSDGFLMGPFTVNAFLG